MLPTGDVQGGLRKLETLLRTIKYPGPVNFNGLSRGDPSAFLPIVSFTLTSFSAPIAEQLMETGLELTGKSDLRFTDTLYKALRDIFQYKPILTKQQFLQWGFSQRKISVVCDVINLVLQKDAQLKKAKVGYPGTHKDRREVHSTLTEADTVSDRPIVVDYTEHLTTRPTHTPHVEASVPDPSGNGMTELEGDREGKDNVMNSSEVEGRLSCLEAGLHRLSVLEERLGKLEKQSNAEKNEGQMITISRESWENLLSRVLLLETKLEMSNKQLNPQLPCLSSASSSPSSISDASEETLTDSLERITNMLKSTSSLLKKTEFSRTLRNDQ